MGPWPEGLTEPRFVGNKFWPLFCALLWLLVACLIHWCIWYGSNVEKGWGAGCSWLINLFALFSMICLGSGAGGLFCCIAFPFCIPWPFSFGESANIWSLTLCCWYWPWNKRFWGVRCSGQTAGCYQTCWGPDTGGCKSPGGSCTGCGVGIYLWLLVFLWKCW